MLGRIAFLCVLTAVRTEKSCNTWHEPFLIGGTEADIGAFPFHVAIHIERPKRNTHLCCGAIITNRLVITSASCTDFYFEAQRAGTYTTYAGAISVRRSKLLAAQKNVVKKIYRHKKFEQGKPGPNDISILVLEGDFLFDDKVAPVVLPEPGEIPVGHAFGVGWAENKSVLSRSGDLFFAEYPLISYETCKAFYDDNPGPAALHDTALCAGPIGVAGEKACCIEDGSPLVQRNKDGKFKLIGIGELLTIA